MFSVRFSISKLHVLRTEKQNDGGRTDKARGEMKSPDKKLMARPGLEPVRSTHYKVGENGKIK